MFTYNAIAIEVASQFPLISYPTLCSQTFQFSKDRHSNTFMETSVFLSVGNLQHFYKHCLLTNKRSLWLTFGPGLIVFSLT